MKKLELVKQLEYLIAFQSNCLSTGDWESFDKVEEKIKKLEEEIVSYSEKKEDTA